MPALTWLINNKMSADTCTDLGRRRKTPNSHHVVITAEVQDIVCIIQVSVGEVNLSGPLSTGISSCNCGRRTKTSAIVKMDYSAHLERLRLLPLSVKLL